MAKKRGLKSQLNRLIVTKPNVKAKITNSTQALITTKSKKHSNETSATNDAPLNSVEQKRFNIPFTQEDTILLVGEGAF
jgi:hypothetical protein